VKRMAIVAFLSATMALSACSVGDNSKDSSSAPTNRHRVPDISGMALPDACTILSRRDYHGGVRMVADNSDVPPGTVLDILKMEPGMRGGEGQVIMLRVAGPLSTNSLPEGCVSRVPGTFGVIILARTVVGFFLMRGATFVMSVPAGGNPTKPGDLFLTDPLLQGCVNRHYRS
jgi:hypothetical protein